MHLKHTQSLVKPTNGIAKVTAVAWSPNGKKLAVCTTDRVVLLFDETDTQKDKFATKPADKGPKNYIVRGLAFSPLGDKLAVAQSDNIVFVYKIGMEWGEKKAICNKFPHSSGVTCIEWPSKRPNEIFYGLAEGKVKVGALKTQKPSTIYQTDSYVTAMSVNPQCTMMVTAHLSGELYVSNLNHLEAGGRKITRHPCVPFALSWGMDIVVAGNDGRIMFYDEDGGEEFCADLRDDDTVKEFTVAACNATGDSVVLGNYDALHMYSRGKDGQWSSTGVTTVKNMYSVTALGWKPDGDKLAVGTLCGVMDLYDICVRRTMYNGCFELTYVSHSQVIVRRIDTNVRIVIRSQYGLEILDTSIRKKRFVVARTENTLLLGDLDTLKLSEIHWHGDGTEKFIFDNPSACLISFAGEVTIVEYGVDEILGSVRTSYTSGHVLSLRVNERPPRAADVERLGQDAAENKKVAYLLDSQTICVRDLVSGSTAMINHTSKKIDWLELNGRGNLLLFRDKECQLHLYDTMTQTRKQLLSFCSYVQWVPGSDVVVAQNRNQLCVWYNISAPDQVTSLTIKGDVDDIERTDGRTEVIVDEGFSQAVYPLDESLIAFGTAIDDTDFIRAMDILDKLVVTPDVEAMWRQLYTHTLEAGDLVIAQRCAAAIGDVSMCKYLGELQDIAKKAELHHGLRGNDHYQVRAKLSLIHGDFKGAELELLNQGRTDECIELFQRFGKHEEAIRVAEEARHPDALEMRQAYFQYLLDSNQDERAAELKAKEGDTIQAVNLYLKGGMPGKAAALIQETDLNQPVQLIDSVATELVRVGMHEKAGDLYERLNDLPRALDHYIRGNSFRKAVELARKCYPARVVDLQEQWGDWLVSQKQVDMAINHYIEAKVYRKAIEAALNARQYVRAMQLVDIVDTETARPYFKQLARHYEDARMYDQAEKCYVAADEPQAAVEMHTRLGNWEIAHKIAQSYMSEAEVSLLYIGQAQKLEGRSKFKEAEKLYLTIGEKDLAINMYKKNRRYDDMIRLVTEHRPELLKETHQFLAQITELDGNMREAEHHYVEADDWHSAVNMYRSNEMWDDAIRVAKFYGGINACKRVTIALLMTLGVAEGQKLLVKHSLVEAAIEHAAEHGSYDLALELATLHMPMKLPDIHLVHALFLEDEDRYAEAEEEFIRADKPKEAIDMYVHRQQWVDAIRVAEKCDPTALPGVYAAQAKQRIEANDLRGAEELFITATQPELAVSMYTERDCWSDALRVARAHLPHKVAELTAGYQASEARAGKGGSKHDFISVGRTLEQSKQWSQAIDTYLNATDKRVENLQDLEEIWERAVTLAREHCQERHVPVTLEVARRLRELGSDELASDLLFDIGRREDAVRLLLQAKKFDKAQNLAKGNADLQSLVERHHTDHLVSREDTKELMELGHREVAIDVLVKRGDWEGVWKVAATEGLRNDVVGKYVLKRIEELLRTDTPAALNEAVKLLSKKPAPATEEALPLYRRVTTKILGRTQTECDGEHESVVGTLREVLYKLAHQYKSSDRRHAGAVLEMLMATHYTHMYYLTRTHRLPDLSAKAAVTLLKYPVYIPADKAYYMAGMACRAQGVANLAFLLLNRYVDIIEAMQYDDVSQLDTMEFADADGLPSIETLPTKQFLETEEARETVRTMVLAYVTDTNIQQRLPSRETVRNTLYECLFSSDRPTCIVTGYPIYAADLLEVNNSTANRRDWNNLVAQTRLCPWTGQAQNPLY